MASTARKEDEKKEYFDSPDDLDKKVSLLAQWIRESRHFIAFTGAGISTGAGIPDFRSGMDTKLETGPGAWELRAKGKMRDSKHKVTTTTKAIPTPTHMMLVKLQQEGILKCVISQNCDGLHRRSGLSRDALFELHGNSNVEKCKKCGRDYLRDFRVRTSRRVHDHKTGRKCDDPKCGRPLFDSIINFGENLPTDVLDASFDHAGKADLCLAMGSSLTVTPAADVAETVGKRRQKLVIVNLQRTPLDHLAKLRIFAKVDDFTELLMSKLGIEIPEFRLKRKVVLSYNPVHQNPGKSIVTIQGADRQGHPFSFLKEVRVQVEGTKRCLEEEPFVCPVLWKEKESKEVDVRVTVVFHSHYGEPPIQHPLTVKKGKGERVELSLEYNPFSGQWAISSSSGMEEVEAQLRDVHI